jgi:hypothetical protein
VARFAFLVALLLLAGCARSMPPGDTTVDAAAKATIMAIKANDMKGLAAHVHPDKGVRFSPYGHVATGADLLFSAGNILTAAQDAKLYTWGAYDGSGNPINFTFAEYMHSFVYDRDFANAPVIELNKIVGQGNTRVNLSEVYPQGSFIEYHFPSTDPYSTFDWKSLRLIFEQKGSEWYLVGISHDQWTI